MYPFPKHVVFYFLYLSLQPSQGTVRGKTRLQPLTSSKTEALRAREYTGLNSKPGIKHLNGEPPLMSLAKHSLPKRQGKQICQKKQEIFNTAMQPLPNLVVIYPAYTKPVLLAVRRG